MGIPHPKTIQKMIAETQPYAVIDVTTNKVISRHTSDVEASKKADERPRDWMAAHISNLPMMGIALE